METNKRIYQMQTKVFSYDSDMASHMKLSAVLKVLQTAAGGHLDENNLTFDTLTANNSIFVMTKVSSNVLRMPKREEPIMVRTWSRQVEGIVFIRDTVLETESGEVLVEASANWILIDPVTHAILRPEALSYTIQFCPELAILGTRTGRMRAPKELSFAAIKRVEYTDCDFIGHMNNTSYADVVSNVLTEGERLQEVEEFDVVYSLEAKQGEELQIFKGYQDGLLWIRGEHPRGKCFEARLKFK